MRTGRSPEAIALKRIDASRGAAVAIGGLGRMPRRHRGVAQPGQSIGLQNRGPRVRILPPLPFSNTKSVVSATPSQPVQPTILPILVSLIPDRGRTSSTRIKKSAEIDVTVASGIVGHSSVTLTHNTYR